MSQFGFGQKPKKASSVASRLQRLDLSSSHDCTFGGC